MMPVLNPAGVQEIIDYGLIGYGLSRHSGTWAALKCVKDNVESTASVDASLDRVTLVLPDIDLPPGGLNIRAELDFLGQEARLHEHKRRAAAAFVAANGLNRILFSGGARPWLGVVSIGKSHLDTRQAFDSLGMDEARAAQLGVRLFKAGCAWPFDREHFSDFVQGLEMVIVVEEKRSLLEVQMKEQLYGTANQPLIIGKHDERGAWLFPAKGALDPNGIAIAIGERVLARIGAHEELAARVSQLKRHQARLADMQSIAQRTPYFCSGCPHNTSTAVPEGSRAAAGIGCHFMALWMDRDTHGFTQMGGEGAQWVGEAPFSATDHIFQNLGDGTYNHSGSLAVRFALSSKATTTYNILFHDAVAMTGGQPHDGGLTVDAIARQMRAEGVDRIAVVTDDPSKYGAQHAFPPHVTLHAREDLDAVQREMRGVKGVSVLIYDQTCAAEKRRRRKRGLMPDPDVRIVINELVCEGCGDCGVKSNCVSVQPVETEFGRKRRIDQTSCNKDFSCIQGLCPSFVTVHGARLKATDAPGVASLPDPLAGVPAPPPFASDAGWSAIINGVGGTGVVTVAAILGMAAHLEGKGCGMIDMAGLAQKGGAVFTHLRIAPTPAQIAAIRVPAGGADLVLAGDLVVAGHRSVLAAARGRVPGHADGQPGARATIFVVNTAETMPGEFTRSADLSLPAARLKRAIAAAAGDGSGDATLDGKSGGGCTFLHATGMAQALFGVTSAANIILLGVAFQKGGVPLAAQAIEQAIRLNGESPEMNIAAFRWGRRAAHAPDEVAALCLSRGAGADAGADRGLDTVVARRVAFLEAYQNSAWSQRYSTRIAALAAAEARACDGSTAIAETAARSLFKLMAVKDEYEVARLYTDGSFARQLKREFAPHGRLEFHLAPPLLGRRDADGRPVKMRFGPWMRWGFRALAAMRALRGTWMDPFGRTAERRMERALLYRFEADLDLIAAALTPLNAADMLELAALPQSVRGYGHVKEAAAATVDARRAALMARLSADAASGRLAAE
jgi:indolepyruvate ferredoxin oxidoreductase